MKLFRQKYIQNGLALFTGLIFLNMSFFLAEVKALKLDQDKQLFTNIAKLIKNSASEKEKDACGGSADEDSTAKEVNLIFNYSTHIIDRYTSLLKNKRHIINQGIPLLGNYEIYSPPPEA